MVDEGAKLSAVEQCTLGASRPSTHDLASARSFPRRNCHKSVRKCVVVYLPSLGTTQFRFLVLPIPMSLPPHPT
jgi:hypothetical protein